MTLSPPWRNTLAIVPPALFGFAGTYFAIHYTESYGIALFLTLPVIVSFIATAIYNNTGIPHFGKSFGVSLLSLLLLGAFIIGFSVDGLICLLMASPLAAILALAGTALGYGFGLRKPRQLVAMSLALMTIFPFLVAFEGQHPGATPLHTVTSSIIVNAPIQDVWHEVIAFDKITAPPTGIFRHGIAYPLEARIEGEGVGAIRYCIFSTGPFVEPITLWEAPHTLEFDVTANPPPMKELSPWPNLDPPHLHGTFTATHGRFHLYEEDGHSVMEGTTWYRQKIYPDWYWHQFSDAIIHQIHLRVLEHIKATVESHDHLTGT
jgi:hypothetical protein